MSLYRILHRQFGTRVANGLILVIQALLIVIVVLFSDNDFSGFTYLRL